MNPDLKKYSDPDYGVDDDIFTSDADADRELNTSDYNKERIASKLKLHKDLVDQYYAMIDGKFTTLEDVSNLLRAVYEIVARRYFEAKRTGSEFVEDWMRLIRDIPSIYITHTQMEGIQHGITEEIYVLVQKWWNKINDPSNAGSLIMAITKLIDKLASDESNPEAGELLDVKEEIDEELKERLDYNDKPKEVGVYHAVAPRR